MKIFLALILSVLLIVPLCGCSAKEAIASDKQEYIVASVGFDRQGEDVKMLLEAIVVNSDELSNEKENELLSAVGADAAQAFSKIVAKTTQPLMFGHCAVVAVGKNVTPPQLEGIFDFCNKKAKINLAAMFLYTENAQNLLSCKARSSVAVGYDIMSMVEVVAARRGIELLNRLYEVENARKKTMKTVYLPNFKVQDDDFSFDGIAVLKESRFQSLLDDNDTQILAWLTDTVSLGESLIGGDEYKTEYSKTRYKFSFDNKLNIEITIRLTSNADVTLVKDEIEHRFNALRQENGDIFGLGNKIRHQAPKVWARLQNNYEQSFKNAHFTVNVYER